MGRRSNAIAWGQRAVLFSAVIALVAFGLRASGNPIAKVKIADGSIWLASPATGTVVQANPFAKDPTASVRVTGGLGDQLNVVQAGSSAIVLNRSSGEVGRVDGVSLGWRSEHDFGTAGADLALAAGLRANGLYLHDAAQGIVSRLDPDKLSVLSTRKIAPIRSSLAVSADATLWAFDQKQGEVLSLRTNGTSHHRSVTQAGSPAYVTLVGQEPYLLDPTRAEVYSLASGSGRNSKPLCLDEGQGEDLLVAGSAPGAATQQVYALTPQSGLLYTTDVASGRCVRLQVAGTDGSSGPPPGPSAYGAPVANGDLLFIPLVAKGQVVVVDLTRNRIERTVRVAPAGTPFELLHNDGRVWFNNLIGPDAGTLSRSGIASRVFKYDDGRGNIGQGLGIGGSGLALSNDPNAERVDLDPNSGVVSGGRPTPGDTSTTTAANPSSTTTTRRPATSTPPNGGPNKSNDATNSAAGPAAGTIPLNSTVPANSTGSGANTNSISNEVTITPLTDRTPLPAPEVSGTGSTPPGSTGTTAINGPTPNPGTTPPGTTAPPVSTPPIGGIVARIQTSANVIEVGQPVSFSDRSLGNPTSWVWDFGDGATDSRQNPTHSFAKSGRYVVALDVANGTPAGQARVSVVIEVRDKAATDPPAAQFVADLGTAEAGQVVTFTDRSVGKTDTWLWDFGDKERSSANGKVSHTWAAPGTYTVSLTVSNQFGATTATRSVTIVDRVVPPTASFEWSPSRVVAGEQVTFTSTSHGAPTALTWDFGNGQKAQGPSAINQFATPGDQQVRLIVSNSKGQSIATKTLTVLPATTPPTARFSVSAQSVEVDRTILFTSTTTGKATRLVWNFGDGQTATGTAVSHQWARADVYLVTLTASNEAGSTQAGPVPIMVLPSGYRPVKAAFSVHPGSRLDDPVDVSSPASFADRSTGSPTAWLWDFGDGTATDTRANPTHSYTKPGTYPVKLQVSDGRSTDETTQSVYVKAVVTEPAPVANFIISPTKPVAGAIVLFGDRSTNNPTKWRWDFGDRTGAETTPTTSHTFATAGTFAVTLTATNAVGSDTKTVNVEVSPSPKAPPVASFAVRPAPVDRLAGKPLTFEDTTPGAVTAPLWIFPDGDQAPTDGSRRVIHTFPTPGPVTVSMRVCWADDRANCTTMSETIVILRALSLPVPSFVMSGPGVINQQSAAAGIPITFTDTSTGEQLQSWKWVIGNQARSGREVKATIDAGGEVAVLLTVGNPAGEKPVARVIRIVATNPPVAAFGLPPSPVLAGTSVSFVDRSTGSPTAWRWDFGDSTATSSEQNPAHVYATAGTYAVSLVATNASGTSQANATVVVSATPAPTATTAAPAAAPRIQAIGLSLENPGSGSAALVAPRGVEVRFFDVSNVASTLTAGTTWVWDFGDVSAPATGATTSHVYTVAGRYTVKVTVTTRTGGVGSDQLPIKVV